jgi:hypothetical protein
MALELVRKRAESWDHSMRNEGLRRSDADTSTFPEELIRAIEVGIQKTHRERKTHLLLIEQSL